MHQKFSQHLSSKSRVGKTVAAAPPLLRIMLCSAAAEQLLRIITLLNYTVKLKKINLF